MTTGTQDSDGFPGSLPLKASPVLTDTIEIVDNEASGALKQTTLGDLPFVDTASLPLSLVNGGTNASLTASNGGIVYSAAGNLSILPATATADQIILSGSNTTPSWSNATYPASTTINQILYSSANNTITGLTSSNSSLLWTTSAGVPAWSGAMTNGQIVIGSTGATPVLATLTQGAGVTITNAAGSITIAATGSGGTVTSVSGTANRITSTGGATPVIDISASYVGQSSITTLGTITTGVWTGTNIALADGGTNASLTASNGGIFYSTASAGAILAGTATARQMLQSGASTTPAWSTATYPATTTINQILYSSSANTITGLATANNGVLNTNGSGVPSITATPTVQSIAFTPTTGGVIGTTVADSASAGTVGEVISSTILVASAVSLTTGTNTNVTSISLTAGDWDLWGNIFYSAGASTVIVQIYAGISSSTGGLDDSLYSLLSLTFSTGTNQGLVAPCRRFNLSSTTTIYLVALSNFSASTLKASGSIFARRRR